MGASQGPAADLKQIQPAGGQRGRASVSTAPTAAAPRGGPGPGAMTALKQIAGPRPFLLVGDSKLISYTNAAAMNAQGAGFVAPLAASRSRPGCSPRCQPEPVPRGLRPARDAGKPAAARGSYRSSKTRDGPARPAQDRSAGAPAPDPGLLPGKRRRSSQSPARKLATAAEELDRLVRTAGTRFHPTATRRRPRLGIATKRRSGVPAHHDHLRRHRQTRPVLALRPGRRRRRSRRRRLVRPADQPAARPGQPG